MQSTWRLKNWMFIQLQAVIVGMLMMSSMPCAVAEGATKLDTQAFKAAFQGNAEALRDLLQKGANPKAIVSTGMPLIGMAITSKSPDTVAAVLAAQPSVANQTYKISQGGMTSPLIYAITLRQPAIVELLLKAGAKIDWNESNYNMRVSPWL